jgi:hypothetical protein
VGLGHSFGAVFPVVGVVCLGQFVVDFDWV